MDLKKQWTDPRQTAHAQTFFVTTAIDQMKKGWTDHGIKRCIAPLYKNDLDDTRIQAVIDEARRQCGIPDPDSPSALAAAAISATPFSLRDPQLVPPRDWLYGNHLIRKFGSATIAPGGVGKTSIQLVEILALATQRPLLGIKPKQRCRCWYWGGEDPLEEIERRIAAACLHFGIKANEIEGQLFVNSGRDCEIIIASKTRSGTVIATPVVEALINAIKSNGIDVIQIDPFIATHRVSENDNAEIELVAKTWTRIADATGTAIDLSHHARKSNGAEITVEDSRGATALINACRSARALNVMTTDEAKQAGIERRKTYFRIEDANGKANMTQPADKATWYQLRSVMLGNGPPNNPFEGGDKVGVVTSWQWPDPLEGVTGSDFETVAAAIRAGQWRENSQAKDWVGVPVAEALGLSLAVKSERAKVVGMIRIWLAAGSLVTVTALDERRKQKTFVRVKDDD